MCIETQAREEARILIISDDYSVTERLNTVFREAGLIAECANSITAGCEATRSGRFGVVVTTPVLGDGSWRRLVDAADHYDLGFEVILFASTFELSQWAEALAEGASEVLDALHDLPKAAGVAKRALEAAYLKRTRPRQEAELAHLNGRHTSEADYR